MKTAAKTSLFVCLLALAAAPALAWEFDTDTDREGWTRSHCFLDVNEGKLIVTPSPNNNQNVRAVSALGPWDLDLVTGVYMKMTSTRDASGLGNESFHYWSDSLEGKQQQLDMEVLGAPGEPEIVYVDLLGKVVGEELLCFALNFPRIWNKQDDAEVNDISYEVDWVRLEGEYLDNESFEYWDFDNDKIVGWTADAGYEFPDPMDPEHVNGRAYAAVQNGSGSAQTLKQSIKGGGDMAKGTKVMLAAALKVPAAAASAEITLKIAENGVNDATVIAIDTLDVYFDASAEYTLQSDAAERQSLDVEIGISSPSGSKVYVDDIFVAVLPEPNPMPEGAQYGWPVSCVKLAEGQEITVDGVVTPEEYAGAKAVVYNQHTWNAQDPHDSNYIHEALSMNKPDSWFYTPVDDFNETYYVMWDDEALYIAASVQDDNYQFVGPAPNASDMIQVYLTASPNRTFDERRHGYIPTVAPQGETQGSDPVAKSNWGIAFTAFDVLTGEGTTSTYAGKVDPDTQDWAVEVRIPWAMMVTDFNQDLANGDADQDGRDVFPPQIGDVAGITLMCNDMDVDDWGFQSWTHSGKPWEHMGFDRENTFYSNEPLIFEGPAQ